MSTTQTITDDNGSTLGFATLDTRTQLWSLCTANGLDLVCVAPNLASAKVTLADHAEWVAAGCHRG